MRRPEWGPSLQVIRDHVVEEEIMQGAVSAEIPGLEPGWLGRGGLKFYCMRLPDARVCSAPI
jgi:hypothetical protein